MLPLVPFDHPTAGFIAFDSPSLRGTMALVSSFDFVARCRPRELRGQVLSAQSSGDWIHVRDWSKELVNQLLGRVKRRLAAYSLAVEARMPTALTGEAVAVALEGRPEVPFRFSAGVEGQGVDVWFHRVLTPAAEQLLTRPLPQGTVREGDVILF